MFEEDDFDKAPFAGDIFEVPGEEINTPEGKMQGNITLRINTTTGDYWWVQIFGVSKQEWEWMLGKSVQMKSSRVRELLKKYK